MAYILPAVTTPLEINLAVSHGVFHLQPDVRHIA